jgi:hypothetical protein
MGLRRTRTGGVATVTDREFTALFPQFPDSLREKYRHGELYILLYYKFTYMVSPQLWRI